MVEVPSHLFEHFVSDKRTLRLLARHRGATRDPIPDDIFEQLTNSRQLFSGLDLQYQVRCRSGFKQNGVQGSWLRTHTTNCASVKP